jgi:hypothetical protein
VVGAGVDAVSAAYAEIVVDSYLLPGAVVAVFYRAGRDTGMTVDTFFLINPDDRRQFVCLHKQPLLNSVCPQSRLLYGQNLHFFTQEPLVPKLQLLAQAHFT